MTGRCRYTEEEQVSMRYGIQIDEDTFSFTIVDQNYP